MPAPLGLRTQRGAQQILVPNTTFNPATLPLSFWVRAPGALPNWSGLPSAGSSSAAAGRSFQSVGIDPSFASSLNGQAYAAFAGAQAMENDSSLGVSAFINVNAYTMVLLFYVTATAARAAAPYDNTPLFVAVGGDFGIGFSTSGVEPWHYDGAYSGPFTACATGGWHAAFITYDGANLSVAVDSGAAATLAKGAASPPGGQPRIARNWSGTAFLTGNIAEFMMADSVISPANLANIKSYLNTRYALAL